VLASAAQLNRDVQLPASTPTLFFPYPSPDGDMVAVVVRPITVPGASSNSGGVVVITRTGRKLASFGGGGVLTPAWSPASTSLAFTANSGSGSVLRIWSTTGPSAAQRIPTSAGKLYSDCVWSPAGAWILCAAPGANDAGQDWVVAAASGGPLVVTHGPGFPIAWLGETQ
jgi:Tol biopolymer transport system component